MGKKNSDRFLRRNACAVIRARDGSGRVHAFQRVGHPGAWQLPQGGIDPGETPAQALRRELKEELGTDRLLPLASALEPFPYYFPDWVLERLRRKLGREPEPGQLQYYFFFEFLEGAENEINFGTDPEFNDHRLLRPIEVLECTPDFKKEAYRHAFHAFGLL